MMGSVPDVVARLEVRGLLTRSRVRQGARLPAFVADLLGEALPADLAAFYREDIVRLSDFTAIRPTWHAHSGWRDSGLARLLHVQAIPLFDDGCGNLFG